jgi:hypothetical protein
MASNEQCLISTQKIKGTEASLKDELTGKTNMTKFNAVKT